MTRVESGDFREAWELQLEPSIADMMQIQVSDYPQLQMLCWNRDANACLTGEEAFSAYEINWRWVEVDALTVDERALIDTLVRQYGPLLVS